MNRILIDLTDLEKWSGLHGGTQRVTYGIAKHFYFKQASLPFEVAFMSFSAEEKKFYQSDFEPIYNHIENAADPIDPEITVTSKGLKQRIKPYIPKPVRTNRHVKRLYDTVK